MAKHAPRGKGDEILKSGHGGARTGAGKPKGHKSAKTISKEQARDALRAIVLAEMREMTAAQIANAKGVKYLVVRQKSTGKFLRVGEIRARALKDDEEVIEVWEKDPSVQAYTDLMNRALDKPKEQEQEIKVTGLEGRIASLLAGRTLAAKAKRVD